MTHEDLVFRLWFAMSEHGYVDLDELTTSEDRYVVGVMVRARLAYVHRGRLKQHRLSSQIDRWAAVR